MPPVPQERLPDKVDKQYGQGPARDLLGLARASAASAGVGGLATRATRARRPAPSRTFLFVFGPDGELLRQAIARTAPYLDEASGDQALFLSVGDPRGSGDQFRKAVGEEELAQIAARWNGGVNTRGESAVAAQFEGHALASGLGLGLAELPVVLVLGEGVSERARIKLPRFGGGDELLAGDICKIFCDVASAPTVSVSAIQQQVDTCVKASVPDMPEAQAEILTLLSRESKRVVTSKVASRLVRGAGAIGTELRSLVTRGLIDNVSRHGYALTPKGRATADRLGLL